MKEKEIRAIKLFRVLGNTTRYTILKKLMIGPMNVKEIKKATRKSAPAVSAHLRILRLYDLVKYKTINGEKVYSLKRHWIKTLLVDVENHMARFKLKGV